MRVEGMPWPTDRCNLLRASCVLDVTQPNIPLHEDDVLATLDEIKGQSRPKKKRFGYLKENPHKKYLVNWHVIYILYHNLLEKYKIIHRKNNKI